MNWKTFKCLGHLKAAPVLCCSPVGLTGREGRTDGRRESHVDIKEEKKREGKEGKDSGHQLSQTAVEEKGRN